MNDVSFSLSVLEAIHNEAARDDTTFAERGGLYAAAEAMCGKFKTHIDENLGNNGYAHQKLRGYRSHIAAALGFDIASGHDKAQHLGWAWGEFRTLQQVLNEAEIKAR